MKHIFTLMVLLSFSAHAEPLKSMQDVANAAKNSVESTADPLYLVELTDQVTSSGKTVRKLVEVKRDSNGKLPLLLPNRIYRRKDAKLKGYVYDKTNSKGQFGTPSHSLTPHSTLPGQWFGGSADDWFVFSPPANNQPDPETGKIEDWRRIPARTNVPAEYTFFVQTEPAEHLTYEYPDSTQQPRRTSLAKDSNHR